MSPRTGSPSAPGFRNTARNTKAEGFRLTAQPLWTSSAWCGTSTPTGSTAV
jgi:hypothetical protein